MTEAKRSLCDVLIQARERAFGPPALSRGELSALRKDVDLLEEHTLLRLESLSEALTWLPCEAPREAHSTLGETVRELAVLGHRAHELRLQIEQALRASEQEGAL